MRLCVHVTPKASSNQLKGWKEDACGMRELCVSVTAPPEGGKATREVCALVAKSLGIAKGKVSCVRGEASRHKQLECDVDAEVFEEWCARQ